MYKLTFASVTNPNDKFTVDCDGIRLLDNVTDFSAKSDMDTIEYRDYTHHKDNGKLGDNTLDFGIMVLGDIDYTAFEKFIRQFDSQFILIVEQMDGTKRMALCKNYQENVSPKGSTNFYEWRFSVYVESNWIDTVSVGFDLSTTPEQISNYANSDTYEDGYVFTENFMYGGSANTLESFVVNLPTNTGDKYAYLRVNIKDADAGFAYGLNNPYGETQLAYESDNTLIFDPANEYIIIDSIPFFRQIRQRKYNSTEYVNVQEKRNFLKRTYLTIPTGDNWLEFSGVRRGTVILYIQYKLPF